MKTYLAWVCMAAAAAGGAPSATEGPAARPPMGFEDLQGLYRQADLVVQFQVETVQANPSVAPRLAWEVRGPVLEVIRGRLLPGAISVHVDSIVRVFDLPRSDLEGKAFVAALKPLGDAVQRRFEVVGQYAFPAEGNEADVLRQLAQTDLSAGSGGEALQLVVRPIDKVFPVAGPKVIEARLTNTGKDSATYLQAPVSEKDGRLYLTGQGLLRIRDTTGQTVPDKGNIVVGMAPPPPPRPALILPGANFVETIDLEKYFSLPAGRYTLVLLLATPDGRGRIPSNGFTFQVGAVGAADVAAEPPPAETTATATPPAPPLTPGPGPSQRTVSPPKPAAQVPDPASYKPGKASAGLAALLRPAKATFAVGEPVEIELRLINEGPRTVAVDTRLERALTVRVESVGDSPQPLVIRQVIPWPADGPDLPEQRAYLREGAFWGRSLNLNTLYGRGLADFPAPTAEEIAAGKDLSYERFGRHVYGFPKPGLYNVTATYTVARPPAEAGQGSAPHKLWWSGEAESNTITIQVTDRPR